MSALASLPLWASFMAWGVSKRLQVSALRWVLTGQMAAAMAGTAMAQSPIASPNPGASVRAEFLLRPVDPRWAPLKQAVEDEGFSSEALTMLRASYEASGAQASSERAAGSRPSKVFASSNRPASPELRLQSDAFASKAPSVELKPALHRLYIEGERNAVLNFQRLALAAMSVGQWELAEKALDQALLRIDAIYANNEQAEKARSVFTQEQAKDFKGEPYERAMAYYYRGLLYAARADYQNARAMFMQAEYQDTVAEVEKYVGDFGVMPLLAAWASACDGNASLAQEFRERAVKADATLSAFDAGKRTLVIYEAGRAPYKFHVGQHGQGLAWMRHGTAAGRPATPVCAASAASSVATAPVCTTAFVKAGDVGFQATTRGGRAVDVILQGKASFKDNAQGVADAAQQVSTVALLTSAQTGNRDMANLGIAGLLVGLAAQAASSNTQAQADIREWEQLPLELWLGQLSAPVPERSLAMGDRSFVRLGEGGACQLFWGREHPATRRFYEAGPVEPSQEKRDEAFRSGLAALF